MSDVTSEAKEDKTIQTESIGTSGERSPDHAGLAQMSTTVEYPLYDTKGGGIPPCIIRDIGHTSIYLGKMQASRYQDMARKKAKKVPRKMRSPGDARERSDGERKKARI